MKLNDIAVLFCGKYKLYYIIVYFILQNFRYRIIQVCTRIDRIDKSRPSFFGTQSQYSFLAAKS